MTAFGLRGSSEYVVLGASTASTIGNTATSSGSTADTKGAWQQLTASLAQDAESMMLLVGQGLQSRSYMFDLGIGGAGSEIVIAENLYYECSSISHRGLALWLPMSIAAGQRVALRCQANSGVSQTMNYIVTMITSPLGFPSGFDRCKMLGAVAASTALTQLADPGGTAHTKGAWTEIAASADFDIQAFYLAVSQVDNGTIGIDQTHLIDIGIGAASAEVEFLRNQYVSVDTVADTPGPMYIGPYLCNIPSGTRISARHQTNDTDATDRRISVGILAFG